ncbi:hypothetical protein [Pantoea rodasii]|uniref:hypothetical protein n=1 Tax=Pantoea rodasii TaxID=1076549 RepID=UPI0012FDF86B|nr:hypothetical protein [Pantoea rodasii]
MLGSSITDDLGWMLEESADRWCWKYSIPSVVFDVDEGNNDHPGYAQEGRVIWDVAGKNVDSDHNGCEWYEVDK